MTTLAERSAAELGYIGIPYALATLTTANGQRVAIPDAWDNRFVDFSADTKDVWIRFGDGGVVVSPTAVSTLSSEDPVEGAGTPHLYIPAGVTKPVLIRKGHAMTAAGEATQTHFAHISLATGGYLRFTLSTGPGEP